MATGWCQGPPPPGPQSFAEETLRTLCLAYKRVDEDTYEEWRQRHREASLRLQNRAHALHQVYEEMERGLQVGGARRGRAGRPASARALTNPPRPRPQLLGATAIEDRLQDGVCDTIQCLKQGNIKVWVLTGDKQGGSPGRREKGDGWESAPHLPGQATALLSHLSGLGVALRVKPGREERARLMLGSPRHLHRAGWPCAEAS